MKLLKYYWYRNIRLLSKWHPNYKAITVPQVIKLLSQILTAFRRPSRRDLQTPSYIIEIRSVCAKQRIKPIYIYICIILRDLVWFSVQLKQPREGISVPIRSNLFKGVGVADVGLGRLTDLRQKVCREIRIYCLLLSVYYMHGRD